MTVWNTRKMIFVGYDADGMAIYREPEQPK